MILIKCDVCNQQLNSTKAITELPKPQQFQDVKDVCQTCLTKIKTIEAVTKKRIEKLIDETVSNYVRQLMYEATEELSNK